MSCLLALLSSFCCLLDFHTLYLVGESNWVWVSLVVRFFCEVFLCVIIFGHIQTSLGYRAISSMRTQCPAFRLSPQFLFNSPPLKQAASCWASEVSASKASGSRFCLVKTASIYAYQALLCDHCLVYAHSSLANPEPLFMRLSLLNLFEVHQYEASRSWSPRGCFFLSLTLQSNFLALLFKSSKAWRGSPKGQDWPFKVRLLSRWPDFSQVA